MVVRSTWIRSEGGGEGGGEEQVVEEEEERRAWKRWRISSWI